MKMSIFSVQDHYPSAPRSLGQLYGQVLDQARQAERLGYDTFWVAEHHFHEYGAVPNPAVFLAALSQQTRRLRLGTAISILTFHNPLTVAENYALVDQLSQGRLSLGVGSGYLKHEFEGYDVDPAIKRERFDENLMLVERLLAESVSRTKAVTTPFARCGSMCSRCSSRCRSTWPSCAARPPITWVARGAACCSCPTRRWTASRKSA